MKIHLNESGIQNIRQIAKEFNKAIIYFHIDLDGVTSAISAKYYLAKYGIETIDCEKIQYGSQEWAIRKAENGILPVLVDFSHGKPFMRIHTDHHSSQISYQGSSKNFRHSKSNAETLSSIISTNNIFSQEDIRIISMVDSAGYQEENVSPEEMLQIMLKTDKTKDVWRNHIQMGMVVGKLLLTYKNKPNYLEQIVMQSKPSLMSMYSIMMKIIKGHIEAGDKGWFSLEQIQKNSDEYRKQQEGKKIENGDINSVYSMKNGQSLLIDNTIVQVGAGRTSKSGMYDRYTAFRLYPKAKYFLMIWNTLGMMQLSKNPWDEEKNNIHLGDMVFDNIIDTKMKHVLYSDEYRISLLAIKFANEEKLTPENEDHVIGYKFNDFVKDYSRPLEHMSDKQKALIEKYMNWKPSQFVNGNEKDISRALDMLSKFYVPLYDIVKLQSGGHPAITNLTGFGYISVQQKIQKILADGKNPYIKEKSISKDKNKDKDKDKSSYSYISKQEKLMKIIAKQILEVLLGKKAYKKITPTKKGIKSESLSNERIANRALIKYLKNFDNSILESLDESLYDDFYQSLKEYYDNYEYKRQRYSKMDLVKGLCESLKNDKVSESLKTLIKNILI